jgi:hypothetical protein
VAGIAGGGAGAIGVAGTSDTGDGVQGISRSSAKSGVFGRNDSTAAATAPAGSGVFGLTVAVGGVGVFGTNNSNSKGRGVQGNGPEVGVGGFSDQGSGVLAQSNGGSGLVATSDRKQGISAFSNNDIGVFAQGATFAGVFNGALVVGKGPNPADPSIKPSDINGSIVINDGNLFLNKGDIILANAADCAEDFGLAEETHVEPGAVMVLDAGGRLLLSASEYDKRVAGVISGGGNYKAGLVLDRRPGEARRAPLALFGKTYCKVDADYGAIQAGDMLTTSLTPGHAMKVGDSVRAFGAVIGKALAHLESGRGLIPILIALQ